MKTPDVATEFTLTGFGDEIDDDPAIQAAVLRSVGARYIEVRSAWGINIVDMTLGQVHRLADLFLGKDMGVSAVASPVGKVDVSLPIADEISRLQRAIAAAKILRASYIRIFSFYYPGRSAAEVREEVVNHLKALVRVAEDSGVTLLHENEKRIFGDVPTRIVDLMESVDSPAFRVAWDPANFVQVGIRPLSDAYVGLRPYFAYLQVKDALSDTGKVRVAGEGDGEIRDTVRALSASGYSGFASLEPHLTEAGDLGGFSGPAAFGVAARSFREITNNEGVRLV